MYLDCCGAFIEGDALPTTPEQLMRSRFTAYATNRIDYIKKTMSGKALKIFNRGSQTSASLNWQDLTILDAPLPTTDEGTVEFVARYLLNGEIHSMHEKSKFRFHKKRWFYTDKINN